MANQQEISKEIAEKFLLPVKYRSTFSKISNNIWDEYAKLVIAQKPIDLGAAYQDFPVPEHVTKALSNIAKGDDFHQYTHDLGHPHLANTLSKLYSQLTGHEINPTSEILITIGAYEALYCSIEGHVSPGDEVIIIEPFFTCFEVMVKCAGGIPVYLTLHPVCCSKEKPLLNTVRASDWILDPDELTSAFNSRTKAIIVNTPHNPLGKVFTLEELSMIAELCRKWNVLCISDEVYEFITYESNEHIRIATLPGMWERTVTIGSAGKIFGVTGWKIGWAYGHERIMKNLAAVHLNSVFTVPTPLQEAIAQVWDLELTRFGQPDSYLKILTQKLEAKRDCMIKILSDTGIVPTIPDGGYFMLGNWSAFESKLDLQSETGSSNDIRFTKWLIKNLKIFCFPSSIYYSKSSQRIGERYVRLCFIKKDETISKAANNFKIWKQNDFKINV